MTERSTTEVAILKQMVNQRKQVLVMRVLDTLERTIQLQGLKPDTPVDEVRARFTDESARAIAVLVEAVDILESIIFASDGCMGHRDCAHSMEPWQRARKLLDGKWEADTDPEAESWP